MAGAASMKLDTPRAAGRRLSHCGQREPYGRSSMIRHRVHTEQSSPVLAMSGPRAPRLRVRGPGAAAARAAWRARKASTEAAWKAKSQRVL